MGVGSRYVTAPKLIIVSGGVIEIRDFGLVTGTPVSGRAPRGPSMADVAAVAGVSHQTVSRVLNNKGKVSGPTRERVLQAISELGYRRNEIARALASNSSRLIGIVTPQFVNFGPATTLLSVQLAANQKKYLVSVAVLPELSSETLRRSVDDFLSLGVAGLIAITPVERLASDLDLQDIPVPTLTVASSWVREDSKFPRIGVDQRQGVFEAMRHLKERGAQTIAFVAGPPDWFDAREREIAWSRSLSDLGLTAGVRIQGDWSARRGREIAAHFAAHPLPDAILVANDQMSFGLLQGLAELGVQVPRDVLVVGFDDEEGSAFFIPALTTVRQDFRAVGFEAIEMLNRMIDGQPVESKVLPAKLKVRQSA